MAQIWGPKLLHGLLAAATDIWLIRLTRRVIGERYVDAAVGRVSHGSDVSPADWLVVSSTCR